MRELLSKYSKVHPHFLLDVFEEEDGPKWKRKLDMAVETFYSTREDEEFGKKSFCRAESALFMWIYIVFKQRENKHAQKKSSSTIQFRLRAGFSEWVHGIALSRRMTSQFSPLVLSKEDSCDIDRINCGSQILKFSFA